MQKSIILFIISSLFFFNFIKFPAFAVENEVRDIFFPTDPSCTFIESFGDGRYNHSHEGTDIMGEQMTPLYAAVDGYISYLVDPEASWGYHLVIKDADGYEYHYLHINNDTPGTDDGRGGVENAYAPGIKRGVEVKRGQLVAYMGDSGNAEDIARHLHFEIHKPDGSIINPYYSLKAALSNKSYDPETAILKNASINDELNLQENDQGLCLSGSLIKTAESPAVYYCGANSRRYVFPNEKIFYSWYENFDDAITLKAESMEAIPLGGNVRYKPGSRMIKLQTSPKVYVIESGGILRWVESAEVATELYGEYWNRYIDDLLESLFMDYQIGEALSTAYKHN